MSSKGQKRLKGVVVCRPFIYGNVAIELIPKKQDHTHEWTVFVKSCDGSDLSHIFEKVEIKLHETFFNSNRVLKNPPYKVTETGWGEFEVIIKLHFPACSAEKPISLYHMLKLYPPESQAATWPKNKQVNNIFSDPTEEFFEILLANKGPGLPVTVGSEHPFSLELELSESKLLDEALLKTRDQQKEYRTQLETMEKRIDQLRSEIAILETQSR
ncbi:hypothetical protein BB559_001830 [Furculomyces boomerangus]|uniref:Protein AF-9 homolog n=1 Tax=Furculomyces boomerangus TaxID=61424 RepID=A0A2T9Z091_9FUNG|nr:hypothetical protein BB559_001830 [Furculomyces boomerangus]